MGGGLQPRHWFQTVRIVLRYTTILLKIFIDAYFWRSTPPKRGFSRPTWVTHSCDTCASGALLDYVNYCVTCVLRRAKNLTDSLYWLYNIKVCFFVFVYYSAAQVAKICISLAVFCTYGLQFFVCLEIAWTKIQENYKKATIYHNYVLRTVLVTLSGE